MTTMISTTTNEHRHRREEPVTAKKTFRVPSRYMAAQRYGRKTYEILDGFAHDKTVASGFPTIEAAMRWIWQMDQARSQAEANRIMKTKSDLK
jgi:hypothetical protein